MKSYAKILALLLALLTLAMCFASCGGGSETETDPKGEQTTDTETKATETEDPRQAVKDDIPADLTFANEANNTVTFFIPFFSDFFSVSEVPLSPFMTSSK